MPTYKCYIYKQNEKQPMRRTYLHFIPRIGETITFYSGKEHDFVSYLVVNIQYIIDTTGRLEPIIKIYI